MGNNLTKENIKSKYPTIDSIFNNGNADISTIESTREFHTEEASTYWLPKDDEEQQRLTGQHFALKELYESNLLSSVEEALDFEKGVSVLDIGCGSGIWIMDMLSDFPNCSYYGCDMVDTTNKNLKIKLDFKIGNILNGLPYADNTFDLVNMRLFVFALREDEWPAVISELMRVARQGGIVQIVEVDLKMTDEENEAYHRLLVAIHKVCEQRSQNPRIALELERLVSENKNAKVLQSDYRSCKMNSKTSTAKKFAWDWVELAKGIFSWTKPFLNVRTHEEEKQFIHELRYCLYNMDCIVYFNGISARKL